MAAGRVTVTVKVELPTYSVREALDKQAPKIVEAIEGLYEESGPYVVGRPKREPPRVKSVAVTK